MPQSTQSTLSTLTSVPQWDPIEALNIGKSDGNFTCSGINKTKNPCGIHLSGKKASQISKLLYDISMLPPQSAIQSLRNLADVTLCQHHGTQAGDKVTEWTAAINRPPPSTQAGPNIAGAHTPSPPHRPALAPRSTPSLPPGSNVSSWSLGSRIRSQRSDNRSPTPQTSNGTVEEDVRLLREEIMLLTARIDSLETGREETVDTASPRRVSGPSSARLGLRLGLFGRNNN